MRKARFREWANNGAGITGREEACSARFFETIFVRDAENAVPYELKYRFAALEFHFAASSTGGSVAFRVSPPGGSLYKWYFFVPLVILHKRTKKIYIECRLTIYINFDKI